MRMFPTLAVVAALAGAVLAPAEAEAVSLPPGNLEPNPSFESDILNWTGLGMKSRVAAADAPHGSAVAKVVPGSSGSSSLDDYRNPLLADSPSYLGASNEPTATPGRRT